MTTKLINEAFDKWWPSYVIDPNYSYSADEKEAHMREAFRAGVEVSRKELDALKIGRDEAIRAENDVRQILTITTDENDLLIKTVKKLELKQEQRNGNWLDKWGCCKVCDGEIPHGHTADCDIFKLEQTIRRINTRSGFATTTNPQ